MKSLLKRGAWLAAANWPLVAIQFAAQTTFQLLLAVPVVGAALMAAVFFGTDMNHVLAGSIQEAVDRVVEALTAEPLALSAFIAGFGVVLVAGVGLQCLAKAGTIWSMLAADRATGPIEDAPLGSDTMRQASLFALEPYVHGAGRLFPRYCVLAAWLTVIYVSSGLAYLGIVVYGYQFADSRGWLVVWTAAAAISAVALVFWVTAVNVVYLFLQIASAVEDIGPRQALRRVTVFMHEQRDQLVRVVAVLFAMVATATVASAIAWSGVGLIAFVPWVGLVVWPLQVAAWLVRGLIFEFIGLTALSAYGHLYRRHLGESSPALAPVPPAGASRWEADSSEP